jgi:hypothetical protein
MTRRYPAQIRLTLGRASGGSGAYCRQQRPTIIVETANRFARDLMVQEVGFAMLRDYSKDSEGRREHLCARQSDGARTCPPCQSGKKFLKRVGLSSVYLTVCLMSLWPRYAWIERVSRPALARA